jgi:Na+:H+ antiporter, NhaA family
MAPTGSEPARPSRPGLRAPWAYSDRPVPRRVVRPLQEFLQASTSGGVLLVAAAILALVWANSPFADTYERLWRTELSVGLGGWAITEDLRYWVNDGLMALFFLVVGLEIKRELLTGELRGPRAAALPAIAAVGGMVVPALIYLAINVGGEGSRGWGIAMPTDIAFTLGILALAAPNAPPGLKPFVLTLAIVDDILTIVVIAIFYRTGVEIPTLLLAAGAGLAMLFLQRIHVRASPIYVALGVGMWVAMQASGVDPALSGVAVGLLTPAVPFQRPRDVSEEAVRVADETVDEPDPPDADAHWWLRLAWLSKEAVSPLARLEHVLLPWTTFVVLPVFALANAGVTLSTESVAAALESPIALGLSVGRVAGKIVGIGLATWFAVRIRAARLPEGTGFLHVLGVAAAAGISFTVSLFVVGLAFSEHAPLVAEAKLGILASALIAGPLGYVLLRASTRSGDAAPVEPAEKPIAEAPLV